MTTRTTSVTDTSPSADAAPGVQLVQPEVAQATQPGLFDDLPDSDFTVHHRALIDARVGDRMLLCLALDVSASAVKVAVALAYHGWSSWPSRETLAQLCNLHPNHVSRACKELEEKGFVSRRRRYHKGGAVGIQYTFYGEALATATVDQGHPTLGPSISALAADSGANTDLVSAPGSRTRTTREPRIPIWYRRRSEDEDHQRAANTDLVSAQPEPRPREYQIGIGANTNLVPEPEVTEPERVTMTDEINQSLSGSSGSGDARAKNEPPPWYLELTAALDPSRVPDLQAIEEQALLAGWSAAVLQSAARVYLRNYRNQRVTDPFALFRKLAIQEASRLPTPEPQRQRRYSDEHRRRRPEAT